MATNRKKNSKEIKNNLEEDRESKEKAEKINRSWNAARAIVQGQGRIDTKCCCY